jgi:hypothetical protein
MKDQLQHYLKKHISPTGQKRAEVEKKMTSLNENESKHFVPKLPEFIPSKTN